MVLLKNYDEFLLEKKSDEIICYHRSSILEHMLVGDFQLSKSKDDSIFGSAIYFSSSPNISTHFGKYLCKFSIKLEEPILDMNKIIPNYEANTLLWNFNEMFNLNVKYNFQDDFLDYYKGVQYGQFFDMIMEYQRSDYTKYTKNFKNFIQKYMGFNSFKYYQNEWTDYKLKKDDYGTAYGLYDNKNIKYIDGPF